MGNRKNRVYQFLIVFMITISMMMIYIVFVVPAVINKYLPQTNTAKMTFYKIENGIVDGQGGFLADSDTRYFMALDYAPRVFGMEIFLDDSLKEDVVVSVYTTDHLSKSWEEYYKQSVKLNKERNVIRINCEKLTTVNGIYLQFETSDDLKIKITNNCIVPYSNHNMLELISHTKFTVVFGVIWIIVILIVGKYGYANCSTREKMKDIIYLLTIFLIQLCIYYNYESYIIIAPDSSSYMYQKLDIHSWGNRTFVYPMLIQWMGYLLGEDIYLGGVVAVQILLFVVAVWCFLKMTKKIVKNKWLSYVITFLLGSNPSLLTYNVMILSESLAISLSVIFLYSIVLWINEINVKNGIRMVLVTFLAAMAKPVLAAYSGIALVLLVLQYFWLGGIEQIINVEVKRKILITLSTLLATIIFYIFYAYMAWCNYGTFSLTNLAPRHSLATCLDAGFYRNYSDEEIVNEITDIINEQNENEISLLSWDTTDKVMVLFGENVREININVASFSKSCIKGHKMEYWQYTLRKINTWFDIRYGSFNESGVIHPFIGWVINKMKKLCMWQTIGLGFVLIAAGIVSSIIKGIYRRKFAWYYIGGSAVLLLGEYINFNGSYGEFARLTIYLVPTMVFMIGLYMDEVITLIKKCVKRSNG